MLLSCYLFRLFLERFFADFLDALISFLYSLIMSISLITLRLASLDGAATVSSISEPNGRLLIGLLILLSAAPVAIRPAVSLGFFAVLSPSVFLAIFAPIGFKSLSVLESTASSILRLAILPLSLHISVPISFASESLFLALPTTLLPINL